MMTFAPYIFQPDTKRRPLTTRNMHCPSYEHWLPLVSTLFPAVLRCDIPRAGDLGFFFTLTVKLRITPRSRSWNSSSDVKIGSTTCRSYHTRISVYRYISPFFTLILRRELAIEHWCSLLHYRVFLQRLALALELHFQHLLKTVAARYD